MQLGLILLTPPSTLNLNQARFLQRGCRVACNRNLHPRPVKIPRAAPLDRNVAQVFNLPCRRFATGPQNLQQSVKQDDKALASPTLMTFAQHSRTNQAHANKCQTVNNSRHQWASDWVWLERR